MSTVKHICQYSDPKRRQMCNSLSTRPLSLEHTPTKTATLIDSCTARLEPKPYGVATNCLLSHHSQNIVLFTPFEAHQCGMR